MTKIAGRRAGVADSPSPSPSRGDGSSLGNFHVLNDTGEPVPGFEIQSEGIQAADMAQAINEVMARQDKPWLAYPPSHQDSGPRFCRSTAWTVPPLPSRRHE